MPDNTCTHSRRIGDNYGESCADCGKQLSGYGWGGWFGMNLTGTEQCLHLWSSVSDTDQVCIYCEKWQKVEPSVSVDQGHPGAR